MNRRTFLCGLTLGALAAPLAVQAQQPPARKVPIVGFLHARAPGSSAEEAFRQGLRDLGYRVGQDVILEFRYAEGDPARFVDFAGELVRLGVDLIVAPTPQAVAAARKATTTIPIVFVVVAEPVRTGVVASISRPGGNITGLTLSAGTELAGKRLHILKELIPRLERVAVLWNPSVPDKVVEWERMQEPARALGLGLQSAEVRARGDFEAAFETARNSRAGAMIALAEPLVFMQRDIILNFAVKARLPAIYAWREFVQAGGLIAYGPNVDANYRRAASYVDKILKGTKPGDLPVELPTKFELVINLKTANVLGLTIPQTLLLQADQVIE